MCSGAGMVTAKSNNTASMPVAFSPFNLTLFTSFVFFRSTFRNFVFSHEISAFMSTLFSKFWLFPWNFVFCYVDFIQDFFHKIYYLDFIPKISTFFTNCVLKLNMKTYSCHIFFLLWPLSSSVPLRLIWFTPQWQKWQCAFEGFGICLCVCASQATCSGDVELDLPAGVGEVWLHGAHEAPKIWGNYSSNSRHSPNSRRCVRTTKQQQQELAGWS